VPKKKGDKKKKNATPQRDFSVRRWTEKGEDGKKEKYYAALKRK